MGVIRTTVIGVAALFVLLQSLAFADQITDRARLLLQQKNPQAAYRLLEPLESQRAGDPEYDYLLGIAALDSGERERAVFALERVLAVNPNHAQARAEIARASRSNRLVNCSAEILMATARPRRVSWPR